MKCFYCEKEFEPNHKGSGGMNRQLCFDCLPEGLDRSQRNKIRKQLLVQKAQKQKVKRGCDICGYNKCGSALEWHHLNDDKDFNPSDKLKDSFSSYQKYQEEIQKCILVCANCHREIHANLISL